MTFGLPPPQRNLNNAFAYDLVPSPSVIAAALKAARRVNDFGTAVRIFEGMPSLQLTPRRRRPPADQLPPKGYFLPLTASIERRHALDNTPHGETADNAYDVLAESLLLTFSSARHQVQGREQGPVRAIPRGAQAPAGRARRASEGGALPRGEVKDTLCVYPECLIPGPARVHVSRDGRESRARGRLRSLVAAAPNRLCYNPMAQLATLPLR